MEGQKEPALIRHHAFCEASDQNLDFLSHMYEHLQKTFFSFSAQFKKESMNINI